MNVKLVDIQQPRKLFNLLDTCGMDLRHNQDIGNLICGLAVPGRGIPQLELTVSSSGDLSRLLRYMTR